MWKKKPTIWEV
jgi:hypothetical protein